MSKTKLTSILLVILILTVAGLAACNAVEVVSVAVSEDSVYKTQYVIGEDLDLTGIKLDVKTSDGKGYSVYASDVRQDLRILNFNTQKERQKLPIILEYKKCTATITIDVKNSDAAMRYYTVSYDSKEGSKVESERVAEYAKALSPKEDPIRAGYAFDGWFKEETYNNKFNFSTEVITSDITLYAKWSQLFYVTFLIEGQEPIVKSVKEGETLTEIPQVPSITGMDGKWSRETFTNIHTNITVETVYTVKTFTVTFYYRNPATAQNVRINYYENIPYNCSFAEEYAESIAAMDVPLKLGNTEFIGWDKSFATIDSNLDVYAQYELTKHNVTFDLNYVPDVGSSVYTTVENVVYGNTVSVPSEDPVREGYAFNGWYRQPECTKKWDFNRDGVNGNVSIYAGWTRLYKVRFLVDASIALDTPIEDKVVIEGEEYMLAHLFEVIGGEVTRPQIPARKGYSGSWVVADAAIANVQNDLDIFAAYTINSYTVTFYGMNRIVLKTETVEYGSAATAPEDDPVRNGYSFIGWSKSFDSVESNLEVEAQFTPNYYSIRVYEKNDSSNRTIDNVRYDGLIPLVTPDNPGYRFAGWFTDNGTYQDEWIVSERTLQSYEVKDGVVLTLYSRWIKLYSVSFNVEVRSGVWETVKTIEVDTGKVIPSEEVPAIDARAGYTAEWQQRLLAGSTAVYDWSASVQSDLVFQPVYSPILYTLRFYFPDSVYAERKVYFGESLPAESVPTPTEEINGRTFIAWRQNVSLITVEGDMDIYSDYNTKSYDVTWLNADNQVITVTQVDHGAPASFPVGAYTMPEKAGHTFSKWVTQNEGESLTAVTSAVTARPSFVVNTYSIKFRNPLTNEEYQQYEYGSDTAVTMQQNLLYGTFISLGQIATVPSETGKDFIGWRVMRNGDALILLRRNAVSEFNVTWAISNGSTNTLICQKTGAFVITDEAIYYVADAVNIHTLFDNGTWKSVAHRAVIGEGGKWNLVKGEETEVINEGLISCADLYYMMERDTTFDSILEVSRFKVTYHLDPDNAANVEEEYYDYGSRVVPVDHGTKSGYVFVGWYSDSSYSDLFDFEGLAINADLELYAKWETNSASKGVKYELNSSGDAYAVSDIDSNHVPADGILSVANYYLGLPVNEIKSEAFKNKTAIKGIYLPGTITKIGPMAFMGACNLESITIPDLVTYIPDNCFNGCTSLTKVTFSEHSMLKTIGTSAFAGCTLLSDEITDTEGKSFPDGLESIGDGAFYNCSSFKKLYFPESVVNIGDRAFARTGSLSYVIFARNNPCNLGSDAFSNNDVLFSAFRIYVPNDLTYKASSAVAWNLLSDKIYPYASKDDGGTWSYYTEASKAILVQYLGTETVVTIPNRIVIDGRSYDVATVADYAFGAGVEEVIIAAGVGISADTFTAAVNLYNITLGLPNASTEEDMNVQPQYLYNAFTKNGTLDTLTLTRNTFYLNEIFGGAAPASLKNLVLVFNGNVVSGAYVGNASIINVHIGSNIMSIGVGAFADCTALKNVYIHTEEFEIRQGLSIGTNAFAGCVNLKNFYDSNENAGIPVIVKSVGQGALDGTAWLAAQNKKFVVVGDGILYKYNGDDSVVTLGEGIKKVAPYAFYANSKLAVLSTETGSTVSEIGDSAFEECVSLEAVVFPNSLDVIGARAFYNASKLVTIVGMRSISPRSIGDDAFTGTGRLTAFIRQGNYNLSGAVETDRVKEVSYIVVDDSEGWIYSYESLGGEVTLIKALGSQTVKIPDTMNGANVRYLADYVLQRTVISLEVNSAMRPVRAGSDAVFGGVTRLTEFTVRYLPPIGEEGVGITASLYRLICYNGDLDTIRADAQASIGELFGFDGALPANIVTVKIIGFEYGSADNSIADRFLKDCASVSDVVVEYVKNGEDCEIELENNTGEELNASVGSYAFDGTAWKAAYDSDFITILGGNLIDYKGLSAIAVIPAEVKRINGGAFADADKIEVLYVHSDVTYIADGAFTFTTGSGASAKLAGAVNLKKIFMLGNAPTLGDEGRIFATVAGVDGPKIYRSGSASGYNVSPWLGWRVAVTSTAERGNNVISETTRKVGGSIITEKYLEEYIFDTVENSLIFYRQYTETYVGDKLSYSEDSLKVNLPDSINVNGSSYSGYSLDENVFIHSVTAIKLNVALRYTSNTFDNVKNFEKLTLVGVKTASLSAAKSATINAIIVNRSVRELEYDGSITLDSLLGFTDASAIGRAATLEAISIIEGVTTTVPNLLHNWDGITSVTYPASIASIGPNSFENTAWYNLMASDFVIVGNGLLYKYKGNASTIYIPASVRIINTGAFSNLTQSGDSWSATSSLKVYRVQFETGSVATDILDYAFAGCASLNSVTLPSSMRFIAENAFNGTALGVVDEMLIISGDKQGATLVKYYGSAETVVIPNTVKVISADAFRGNDTIKTLDCSSSLLTTICERAFEGCISLETMTFPNSLAYIGRDAFQNTKWLLNLMNQGTDAVINTGERSIFYHKLSTGNSFTITSSIMSITDGALESFTCVAGGTSKTYTSRVSSVTLATGASISTDDMYGVLKTPTVTTFTSNGAYALSALIGGRAPLDNITSLRFQFGSVKEIAKEYAYGWKNVTNVSNATGVTRIGENAFAGTKWLENATYQLLGGLLVKYDGADEETIVIGDPDNLIRGISDDVFRGNTTVKRILFTSYSEDMVTIPTEAFAGCTSLEYVGMVGNTYLSESAFNGLERDEDGNITTEGNYYGLNIADFYKQGNYYYRMFAGIPAYIKNFGEDAFKDTPWLTAEADKNNGFVIIGGAMIAYLGDEEDIVIPAETSKIYAYVFRGNLDIKSVSFDRYCLMQAIDANTFRDCANLASITLNENIVAVDKTALLGTEWINDNSILTYVDRYNGIVRAVLYVGEGGVVRMPSDITEIAPDAFRGVSTITSVIFYSNSALKHIPEGAFANCTALSSVTIDSASIVIGDGAFEGTPYLAAMINEFVVIGGTLVAYNGSNTSVVLPASVMRIDSGAFRGNTSVTSIDMSATSVVRIEAGSFAGCTSLNNVVFSSSTYQVGKDAFKNTAYLEAFAASADSMLVVNGALIAVKSSASVEVPNTVKYISAGAFAGNTTLTSITFTADLEIEEGTFAGCTSLASVTGLGFISDYGNVFAGTPYATAKTSAGFTVLDGVLVAYSGMGGDVVIPAGVTKIKSDAFFGNTNITSISFAETDGGVRIEIEEGAFRNCINLASVAFIENVDAIGYRAFYNTKWLKAIESDSSAQPFIVINGKLLSYIREGDSVNIPSDISYIASGVFAGNTNITSLSFAERVDTMEIAAEAFKDCSKLSAIAFSSGSIIIGKDAFLGTGWYNRQSDYVTAGNMLIGYKGNAADIVIPQNVTSICDYVFSGSNKYYSLSFAYGTRITSLNGSTFAGCTSLATVALPTSLMHLDISVFEGTPWLAAQGDMIIVDTRLVAYNGVGGNVVIPATVQSIGDGAFTNNVSVTGVSFADGSYVKSIPAGAFAGCTSLTSFTFPEGIEYVGEGAFEGTPWYASLTNTDEGGVLRDGAYIHNGILLFYKGDAVNYTIPAGVTQIAQDAFTGTTVKTVTINEALPSAIKPGAALSEMTAIYVPEANLNDYRGAQAWSRYYTILRAIQ